MIIINMYKRPVFELKHTNLSLFNIACPKKYTSFLTQRIIYGIVFFKLQDLKKDFINYSFELIIVYYIL